MMIDMRALLGAEHLRRQELAEAELEKRELMELLRDLQPIRSQIPVNQTVTDQHQGALQTIEEHTDTRQQQREVFSHLSVIEKAPPQPPKREEGERKGGSRSLTLDNIKRKTREVTVI